MQVRLLIASMLCSLLAAWSPASAQQVPPPPAPVTVPVLPPPPEELVLRGNNLITVLINEQPVTLEVTAEAFGAPVLNPDAAARLGLVGNSRRGWLFGPVEVEGVAGMQRVDFGLGPVPLPIAWTPHQTSRVADGVIGVHDLPHRRVTFALAEPAAGETWHRFPLTRTGGRGDTRIGTEVLAGKKLLTVIFVPERSENVVTAPTANFIATHFEGGFAPGSDGSVELSFGVRRPTRTMRLAIPLMLGEFPIEQFAVRVEDYGNPSRVGEIGENDPRFEKGRILVSRRKGKGKPDLLTRIGRDQIAHCSRITYDLEWSEIRLSCAPHHE
jgi:hypothetical protein